MCLCVCVYVFSLAHYLRRILRFMCVRREKTSGRERERERKKKRGEKKKKVNFWSASWHRIFLFIGLIWLRMCCNSHAVTKNILTRNNSLSCFYQVMVDNDRRVQYPPSLFGGWNTPSGRWRVIFASFNETFIWGEIDFSSLSRLFPLVRFSNWKWTSVRREENFFSSPKKRRD